MNLQLLAHKLIKWLPGECADWFFDNIMTILGDPGADIGGEVKSKRAGKYGTKKSKERREEPLWTMSYQTSSKRSPPFCLLIGQKNINVFWHQSEVRTAATKEKASKGKFFGPDKLQNHSNEGKGEEKTKSETKERRRREKKAMFVLLVLIMATFGRKKLLDAKGPFGDNVFKNPARCTKV